MDFLENLNNFYSEMIRFSQVADHKKLINCCLEKILETIGSRQTYFYLYRDGSKTPECFQASQKNLPPGSDEIEDFNSLLLGSKFWKTLIKKNEAVIVNSFPSDQDLPKKWVSKFKLEKFSIIPSAYCKDLKAVILNANKPEDYSEEDIKLTELLVKITLSFVEKSQQLYLQSLFLDQIDDRVTVTDLEGKITYVNKSVCEFLKMPKEKLIGQSTYIYGEDPQKGASQKKILENTLKNGFWRGEVVNFDPEGNEYFLDCRTNVVYDQEGKKIGLCGISSDITERKNTQKNLVKYKAELEVRNKITRIFLTISDENIYAEVLNFILEILGSRYGIFGYINENGDWVCPSMTRDIWEKCKMPDKEIVFRREIWGGLWGKAMLEKKSLYSNKNFNVPSGHIKISRALDVPVLYKGKLIGNLLVGNKKSDYDEEDLKTLEKIADYISPILSSRLNFEKQKKEKERTRKQLLHAQKLESVGRLAGGVAHDYNNMLGVILGYAEMVLNNESVSEQVRCDVQEIYSAAERASEITQQLLAFAHKQAISPKTIDLNEAVEGMLKMLRRLIGEDIELAWFPGKKLWVTNIDPSQLDQILVNLCLNSRDALTTGGKITIETRNVVVDEEYSGKTPCSGSGEFIMLCVSDNGSGMDKETLEGIFEPFFTTKKFDKGTGLGLATVYGIVQQNKGFINVNTEPSEGTTVKIYLPRSEAEFTEIDSL